MKSQTLIGLYLFWKNWTLWNPKPDHQVFGTSSFQLEFLLAWSFNAFPSFSMIKTPMDLQISMLSSFLSLTLQLSKLDYPE
jgi:hypothetical protein